MNIATMDLSLLLSPFDAICNDAIAGGTALYEGLRKHMPETRRSDRLHIEIVDRSDLNARVEKINNTYKVSIFRGAVEHLVGAFYGLMTYPRFLPQVGDATSEVSSDFLIRIGLIRVPILKSEVESARGDEIEFPCPRDPVRQNFALLLTTKALDFLVAHEIGHIVGGHFEMQSRDIEHSVMSEIGDDSPNWSDQSLACECDADLFATHFTTWVGTHKEAAALIHRSLGVSSWTEMQAALTLHMASIGILFRMMFPTLGDQVKLLHGSHPHPAVRIGASCSYSVAMAVEDREFPPISTNDLFLDSLINLENVWAELHLRGPITTDRALWAEQLRAGVFELLRIHSQYDEDFERHSHVERVWS